MYKPSVLFAFLGIIGLSFTLYGREPYTGGAPSLVGPGSQMRMEDPYFPKLERQNAQFFSQPGIAPQKPWTHWGAGPSSARPPVRPYPSMPLPPRRQIPVFENGGRPERVYPYRVEDDQGIYPMQHERPTLGTPFSQQQTPGVSFPQQQAQAGALDNQQVWNLLSLPTRPANKFRPALDTLSVDPFIKFFLHLLKNTMDQIDDELRNLKSALDSARYILESSKDPRKSKVSIEDISRLNGAYRDLHKVKNNLVMDSTSRETGKTSPSAWTLFRQAYQDLDEKKKTKAMIKAYDELSLQLKNARNQARQLIYQLGINIPSLPFPPREICPNLLIGGAESTPRQSRFRSFFRGRN